MSPVPLLLLATLAQAQAPQFQPVQPELLSAGASFVNAWADVDTDMDLDLYVGFNGAPNRLYRNDNGILVETAGSYALAESRAVRAAAWGDFDADGDPDLAIGFAPGAGPVLRVLRSYAGKYVPLADSLGAREDSGAVRQLVWIDHDGDDDLDLFAAFRDKPNRLFRNDKGRFTDVAPAAGLADGRKTVGAVWFDYDEDGDIDLYVANMDGDANGLFRNEGGKFVDVAEAAGLAWGGRLPGDPANGTVRPCAADVNNDGHLDIFAANYGKNGLFLSRGGGTFEDVSVAWGVAIEGRYDACAFSDFDHDGRIDLYVNGTVTGGTSHPDYLFRNTGTKYEEVTPPNVKALHADHGVAWADLDRDGDEDLALTGTRPDGTHLVLRNAQPAEAARRAVRVRVTDNAGRAIRAAAEVRVYAKGTQQLLGTRLVDAGSGYNAQNDAPVHIPLAQVQAVDVEVTFPKAGTRVKAKLTAEPREWQAGVLFVRVPGP